MATIIDGPRLKLDVEKLRQESYNAEVISIRRCHEDLMAIRVRPDCGIPEFAAGQYTVLGLGNWELRVPEVQAELPHKQNTPQLIKRAYSISSGLVDAQGHLVRATRDSALEFYITLIRQAAGRAPALTPRLFNLRPGDRLFCGTHPHGNYTLRRVRKDDDVLFAATGTGEAPHNAMLGELLMTGHRGRIAMVTCVRHKRDLGYLAAHREVERQHAKYRYLALTTREPENVDPAAVGYVGKQYLQDFLVSQSFAHRMGFAISPERTRVFVCGNPTMIGVPLQTHDLTQRYPKPRGVVEVLERRGFRVDCPHAPGNIHFEKYW